MKKRFRGYDVKQVDELVGSLQSQNETLVAKIANLTMQLTAAESNPEKDEAIQSLKDQLRKAADSLTKTEQAKAAAEGAVQTLSLEKEELKSKICQLERRQDEDRSASAKVGMICSRAYSDMEKMKQEVFGEILRQIDQYTEKVDDSNRRMREAMQSVDGLYRGMLSSFAGNLEDIFYKLKDIETGCVGIEQTLLPARKIADDLKAQIRGAIQQSLRAQKQEEAEMLGHPSPAAPRSDTVSEKPASDSVSDLLRDLQRSIGQAASSDKTAVKAPEQALPPAKTAESTDPIGKVIGIRTNITADDVFGSNTGSD